MFTPNEEFFSLPFYVDTRVLTPRNDTETMVYQVLKNEQPETTYIDVGTGSSCVISSILKNIKYQATSAFWVDISDDALAVANINRAWLGLQDKLDLRKSNLLEIFLKREEEITGRHLVITANLPYIKNDDIEHMDAEVLENDPHIALFWGKETGFELYEILLEQILELKKIFSGDITLYIEIGFDQYEYSKTYISNLWFKCEYYKDLGGIWRIVKINF